MGRLPATIRPVKREPKRLPSEQTVSSAVLRFRNTSKVYALARQSVAALTDVTVSVGQGEFVALVGRSGCGKTTFLNLAGALDVPSGGDVLIDGLSTVNLDDAQLTQVRRQRVGFVFQFFRLFPTLSAVENVEVPLQLAGLPGVPGARSGPSRPRGDGGSRRAHALSAVRRPDAARRHCESTGPVPGDAAGRRANRQSRQRNSAHDHGPVPAGEHRARNNSHHGNAQHGQRISSGEGDRSE